ncbi:hypothetical protein ABPG72_015910 [Tetrahymena utriculariae]
MFKFLKLRSLDYQLVSSVSQQQAQALATLQSVEYKCQIINNILNIHLSQNFVSKSDTEYSETIYYFPIEEGICLESFEAKYNEKTIKAIVKEKDQAKKEYQENKSQGNFVSYAQTTSVNDQDYCKIELGNLPPGQQVEINIVFSQQLNSLLNKYFVAHIPLIYCDDEVSAKLGKNFLTLDLFCTGKILYAESKGYPVEKIMLDDNTARFNLSQALLQQNTNFQFIFSYEGMFNPQVIFGSSKIFNEDSVKSAILPASHSAMVSFIPNFNEDITQEIDDSIRAAISNGDDIFSDEFQQKLNQELVDHLNSSRSEFIFLLDRSGSMSGQPIRRACEALTLFLKSLPNDSYFNVISFGSSFEKLFPSSIKYTSDSLEKAVYLISKYQADLGGTEIYNPLNNVFVQNRIQGYNKQIFLLTDGEVDSPQSVVRLIKKNSKFNRVHSIGFGSGADQYLIKESAIAGKGISKLVDQKCDLSEAIINMLSLCITPTFDDFKISYDESVFDSTFPSCTNFPCVFKDEIISIHFFFKPLLELQNLTEQQKKIQIEYYDSFNKQMVQKEIKLEMQDSFSCNKQIQESIFKLGKQLYLNENMLDEYSNSQLTQQAIDYQILTKKTALICVIETLNDEQKIMYQNMNHNITYQNTQQILDRNGMNQQQQGALFGMNQQQSLQQGGLFSRARQQATQQMGLFGNIQHKAPQQGGLFGNIQQQSSQNNNLFGIKQQAYGQLQPSLQQQNSAFGFSQQQALQQSGLFSNNYQQLFQQGGLFGISQQQASQKNTLFGTSQQQNSQQGDRFRSDIFNASQQQAEQQGGLFGTNSNQSLQQRNLFSNNQQQPSKQGGLFGTSQQQQTPQNSLFGASQNQQQASNQGGLFGGGLFGNSQQQPSSQQQQNSVFGFSQQQAHQKISLLGTNQQQSSQQGGLFGISKQQASQSSLFSTSQQQASNQGNIFGGYPNGMNQQQDPQQKSYLFKEQQASQQGGLFGMVQQQPQQQDGLFSVSQHQNSQQASQLLNNEQQDSQVKLFCVNQINSSKIVQNDINNNQASIINLEYLLNLVNSEGIWKFDENLVMKLCQIDQNSINQLCYQFSSVDAFMTIFILTILEKNYSQYKSKWVLISKKSANYVKSQLNEGQNFNSIKQNILSLISN